MTDMDTIRINLASRPRRNVRFYRASLVALILLLVALGASSSFVFFKFGHARREARAAAQANEERLRELKSEETRFRARSAAAAKANKGRIDLVNSIIYRKSFSWTGFLTDLEKALPDSCHITSLVPGFLDDASLDLRIKVVSPDLDNLLDFIDRLNAAKFGKIRVQSESVDEQGRLVSEITFHYERPR